MWRKTCEAMGPVSSDALAVLLEQRGQLLLVARGDGKEQLGHDVGELGKPDVERPALLHLCLEPADPAPQVERLARLGRPQPSDHAVRLVLALALVLALVSHPSASIPR